MTNILILQCVILAMVILFEKLSIKYYIFDLLNINPLDTYLNWKVFVIQLLNCNFCLIFWAGTILSIVYLSFYLFILNILIAKLYEQIK